MNDFELLEYHLQEANKAKERIKAELSKAKKKASDDWITKKKEVAAYIGCSTSTFYNKYDGHIRWIDGRGTKKSWVDKHLMEA